MKVTKWDLRSTTKATEALLVKLSNKKWKVGEFIAMSAAQHKSIWVHMELMENDKKRQIVRDRMYKVCCEVYGFLPFRKLKYKAPFSPLLKMGAYRRFVISSLEPLLGQLPGAIRTYILQNLQITRKKRPNIGDSLINFRKFAKEGKGVCICKEVQARLNKHGYKAPKVGGHIAFIGS